MFEFILNFLRSSELAVPKDFTSLKQLRLEAGFYQIMPLKITDGLLVPKESEYLIIEHNQPSITIRGSADLITKYWPNLGQVNSNLTGPTYVTLCFNKNDLYYDSMTYGRTLLRDGW